MVLGGWSWDDLRTAHQFVLTIGGWRAGRIWNSRLARPQDDTSVCLNHWRMAATKGWIFSAGWSR